MCLDAGCKPIERSQISFKVSVPIQELIPGSPQAGTECQRSSLRSDVRRGLKRPIFPSNLRLQCPGQALVQNTMTNTSHGVRLQSRRKSWGTLGSTYSFYPNSAPWPEFCRDNHRLSTQTSATESDGLQSQTLSLTSLEFQCLFFLDELSQQQDLRLP